MNRIVFCLHNCFMRNMNYTHAVWEGRNGCVNLFTCCEMKQCLKNNARTHKKSIKIWGMLKKKSHWCFFLIGFLAYSVFGISAVTLTILAICLAVIIDQTKAHNGPSAGTDDLAPLE